jgi:multidrug efflux system outer membrane protein
VNRSSIVALGLLGSACSFAPVYKQPDVAIPEVHRFSAAESSSIADLPWWEAFRDPVLQDLITEALANNQDLALALARVQEAGALVGVAKADLYPRIDAQVTGTYGQLESKQLVPGTQPSGNYLAAAGLSWELDLWGRVRNAGAAATADLFATEDARHGVVLSLVSGVAQAYLELRELDLELEIARSNNTSRGETLALFQARAKGGIASDLEVSQARADLAETTAAIPSTELAIALKEHQLCVLLGRPPGTIARGVALVDAPVRPQLPAGVPAQLLARRPDLLSAEQNVRAATSRVGVAVANRFPVVSLTGLIGLNTSDPKNVSAADALVWNAGAGLFAPIFQGGRLRAEEQAARARLEQSAAAYRRAVQVALAEVANAAAGARLLGSVRAARADQMEATARAAKLALLRYQGGVSSYLEVLDAQRQLFDSQLAHSRSLLDELASMVVLYRALGGGWQAEAPPTPPEGSAPATSGAGAASPKVVPAAAPKAP